ncbi:MAG: DNA polymerase IV [Clostridia bacterium]|nr:DNA polymerase IV [Clostridia bacterium]
MDKVILHCDLNNFYASVEILTNPSLQGKPVAVTGATELRHGIILAKSNEAKKMGVKTGEPIWQARQKCPDLVCVQPHHKLYEKYSNIVYEIYTRFTDKIERFGIDECWLDVTHSQKLFGDGGTIANTIRETVYNETGLTISVGVSFTKTFAKLGSDLKKPYATTLIPRDSFRRIIWKLPAEDMMGVGRNMKGALSKLNIKTIGDLARADRNMMLTTFGVIGPTLVDIANGIGDDEVADMDNVDAPKSIGNGVTLSHDLDSIDNATPVIYSLSESICSRLRKHNLLAKVVQLTIRDASLSSYNRQCLLPHVTDSASIVGKTALELLKTSHDFSKLPPIRTLTVRLTNLVGCGEVVQESIWDVNNEKSSNLEHNIDKIREKFGYNIIKRGVLVNHSDLEEYYRDDE